MLKNFSLEYWTDDNWYVGRLKEIPGIFSQGETLEELEDNIKDAYELMMEEEPLLPEKKIHTKEIGIDVRNEGTLLENL
ncbi:MAG: type II toxin-antitoxin system HicB family antitoxin [Candidatus Scalindua sp.]